MVDIEKPSPAAATAAAPPKRKTPNIRLPSRLGEASRLEAADALRLLETTPEGLAEAAAGERLQEVGPNEVSREKRHDWLVRFIHAIRNPLVILLSVLAGITFYTAEEPSDYAGGWIMVGMVILGVALRYIQESKADNAAAKLKAMINVTATVVREGKTREVPLQELVPGDIVKLSAGDMIPGDVRLLSCKDLFIVQATLTGECLPVEKFDARETREVSSPLESANLCFLGTSVESGAAQAVVVETGPQTYLGHIAQSISGQSIEPIYCWGNIISSSYSGTSPATGTLVANIGILTNGVHYFNSPMPGYVPFIYPHPLDVSAAVTYLHIKSF